MKLIRFREDLQSLLQQNKFDGCVAVQADQSEEETGFLVDLAKENAFIKGVVGWVDLQADNIEERLDHFKQYEMIKGFRHILQGEKQRDLMLHARYCKISGLITEADWHSWKKEDFIPYLDVVVEAFGSNRILFGSDWPVSLLAGSYEKAVSLVTDYFTPFSKAEQDRFFGKNAIQFYNL